MAQFLPGLICAIKIARHLGSFITVPAGCRTTRLVEGRAKDGFIGLLAWASVPTKCGFDRETCLGLAPHDFTSSAMLFRIVWHVYDGITGAYLSTTAQIIRKLGELKRNLKTHQQSGSLPSSHKILMQ